MEMLGIVLLALAGACGICLGTGAFCTLGVLWKLPLLTLGLTFGLLILAFLFLWFSCALVNMKKPQEKDSAFYRWLIYRYCGLAMTILQVRFQASGFDQIPNKGRFLLVCNHLSLMDPLILHHFFRKSQLAFISKKENYSMFIINKLMYKTLCMSLDREDDRAALHTIKRAIYLLQEDMASVAVFPEGYCSVDGKLHHFRNGVFKIAQRTGVPIVVCSLQNTKPIFRNALHLRRTVVPIRLVRVIQPEEYAGMMTAQIAALVYDSMSASLPKELVAQEETQ